MDNLSRYTWYIQTLIDLVAFLVSFFCAQIIKTLFPIGIMVESFNSYLNLLLIVSIGYMVIQTLLLARENILNRSFTGELRSAFKTTGGVFVILLFYLYVTKTSSNYSRIFMVSFMVLSFFTLVLFRMILKKWIFPLFKNSRNAEKVVIVGKKDDIHKAIAKIHKSNDWRFQITGVIPMDNDENEDYFDQVKVVCKPEEMMDNLVTASVDSVLLVSSMKDLDTADFIRTLNDQGKLVNITIQEYEADENTNRIVDEMGSCAVVRYFPFMTVPKRYQFIKRVLDLIAALVIFPFYAVVYLLTAIIHFFDKGPVIVRRVRVGKNGRRFYQYRFRILKMDRDGTAKQDIPYTWWGKFLSATHLNGLPEILNVIVGDMSFCGPHAPTLHRYLEYSPARRRNLCVLPGIVGGWSLEEEEEDIIFREREYLENWSILKDLAIYFEMVLRYITFHSRRHITDKAVAEELQLIEEFKEDTAPLKYDESAYSHTTTFGEILYLIIKRVIDIVLSGIGIIVLSPILLLLAILVIANDGGSPIYRHTRIGYKGKKIQILKFRSMRRDAGDLKKLLTPEQLEQYQREFKIDDDPRITSIGEFLRKTSLDELPQMINIFIGDLSIIGPRPIVEKETEVYGKDIAKFVSVKPGLTGYWQAYARNNATYESGERQAMEMYYVDHRSLLLDIKIFFKTIVSVLKREGAQ